MRIPLRISARTHVWWLVVLAVGASVATHAWSEVRSSRMAADTPRGSGPSTTGAAGSQKAIFRPSGTGPAYWGPGDLYTFLATGAETNGAYFQFEALVPPQGGPPPHIHTGQEESFYLVEGSLQIMLGDSTYTAKAGDFVHVPRGTPHRFLNVGSGRAKLLVTFVPAGFENFFLETLDPAVDRTATPPPTSAALIQKMQAAAPKYGIVFLPPSEKK